MADLINDITKKNSAFCALALDVSGNPRKIKLERSNGKAESLSPVVSVSLSPKRATRPCNGRDAQSTQPHVPLSCSVEATMQPFTQLKRSKELLSLLWLAAFVFVKFVSGIINMHALIDALTSSKNTGTEDCAPPRGRFGSRRDQDTRRTLPSARPSACGVHARSIM